MSFEESDKIKDTLESIQLWLFDSLEEFQLSSPVFNKYRSEKVLYFELNSNNWKMHCSSDTGLISIVLILKPKELKKRILIENTIHIKDYDNVSAMEALADSFKHAISRIYEELPHF